MNLPASAISFLPSFYGLYSGHETLFTPHTANNLPMVHVHCFSTKSDDNAREAIDICERISKELGVRLKPGEGEDEVRIYDVRDVAPQKRMFCASFRLPDVVAFREKV
jgi:tRNA (guanine37-N1)-methyltransferase